MKRFVTVVLATACILMGGCKSPLPSYIPVHKRAGRAYCYTREFVKGSGSQVEFFRQPMEELFPGGNGEWGINPFAFLILPVALPLAFADWLVASPVIDTVLLPYDIHWNCTHDEDSVSR